MFKVVIDPDVTKDGEFVPPYPETVLLDKMADAGWSDDPRDGKAILTPLGSEILCPIPVSPPIGYVAEPTVMDRLAQMLDQRMRLLNSDDVIDETVEEAEDFNFPDPEDFHPRSVYEIELLPEVPSLPPKAEPAAGNPPEPAREDGENLPIPPAI